MGGIRLGFRVPNNSYGNMIDGCSEVRVMGGMRLGFRVPSNSYGNMIDGWYEVRL